MKAFYLPLIVAIIGALLYHLAQKSIPKEANPLFVLIIAYAVGIIACAFCAIFYPGNTSFLRSLKEANWAAFAVGISVVLIELGFLLAYRAGWRISTATVVANVAVTMLLIPIGVAVFKERLSIRTVIGLAFCLLGLILVSKE